MGALKDFLKFPIEPVTETSFKRLAKSKNGSPALINFCFAKSGVLHVKRIAMKKSRKSLNFVILQAHATCL